MASERPRPRDDLGDLSPYSPEQPPAGILLHANENPCPPPADVMDEIAAEVRRLDLNRYPVLGSGELRDALAAYAGQPPERVWVGTGSNEVLLDACLAYGGTGRTALLFEPSYVMHHRQARIAGTAIETAARRDDFTVDVDAALRAIERVRPAVVFLCSPNNPTGTSTPLEDVRRIARACPGLFVLDEAYYEFSGVSLAPEIESYPNTIVVRTMSKAFRLAGARIGYGIGLPDTLDPLWRVRMPYAQSSLSLAAAVVALRHTGVMLEQVRELSARRAELARALAKLPGVTAFESAANFVLFRHARAADLFVRLAERGIRVRDFSALPGCENCLRVTAGTADEQDAFLEALAQLV